MGVINELRKDSVVDELKNKMGFQSGAKVCSNCKYSWYIERAGGIDVYECRLNPAVHFLIERPKNSSCNYFHEEKKI